ncbi:hypothetical protein conserved [Leishmania donovani]|uniref:Uncharacterized protein n=3 Tax=Leishmania donovani species complex TaxID=38574 RepID=A4I761_LEIIN|nr:conserved hypothetical protein [Leishmania infantum JPCM5]XP_003863350.1 hypothetical protein, conserved [Leishmania donovani]CAC9521006.1 hypothetical_protein_-_conserved [Leishmania infantum]TPP41362.1 hypothetical protein CGC20_2860 [Leishmania donovani]TPP42509.1 hypothetical protein CGC21_10970 [Leishmania donovani]CAJ1991461.1 hypothetical protein conserved [Leishmania donovani]CAM70640.1 conserved hypothetical protein [Leishmania infantum JPCM5]|eukprot:XP_001467580.1 conserved hypothetical protein [Leishmania infantum JPCM5]
MFYTYAEKQGSVFFDSWQMRQIAFDTLRRHLYYSDCVSPEKIAYPNANDNPFPTIGASDDSFEDGEDFDPGLGTTVENPAVSQLILRPPVSPVNQRRHFNEAPPPPNNPDDVQWRKKIKVDMIVAVGKEHVFLLEDTHLKETDLFQIEIHGEVRPMASGETPAPGPLLCPSAGLSGMPNRCTVENDEFIRDPFFLRELYEALRYQFSNLRMERERAELAAGQPVVSANARKTQTLESPRPKGGSVYRGSRIKIVLRMRTDYEFRRFVYVVQTVLGYDKLSARPYRGLPPYDPRNGLIFSVIPMCVWHTFKLLDKTVFYTFLRGDLVGRSAGNQLYVTLRGAYLCITHDSVLVMRDTGNIPRWIKLQEVREFYYNVTGSRPFVAFLSDPGSPDIIFLPQPPVFGPEAIRRFSPSLEVLRMRHVIHETCFASLEIRRVINIKIADMSVRSFVECYERETRRVLDLDAARCYAGVLSCPLPKEQLAQVWREVQGIYAARDPSVISHAAIPLYQNNTNDTALTRDQLETLSRRLARERASRDDIVGMPYEEAQRIQAPARRDSRLHSRHHLTPLQLHETTATQPASDATSVHLDPQSSHSSASPGRGETLAATSSHPRGIQMTTVANLEHAHDQRSAGHDSAYDGSAGSQLEGSAVSATSSPRRPILLSAAPPNASSWTAADASAGGNTHRLSDVSAPNLSGDAAMSSGVDNAFTQTNPRLTQLPNHRLGTPQLSSSVGGGAAGFGASPGFVNASFASSQFGGNSVQYQIPGARYLSEDEIKGGSSCVAVDHHTVLMGETPLVAEGTVTALLSSTELNVSEIVNKSITAMQATAPPPPKRSNSAEPSKDTRKGSEGKAASAALASPRTRAGRPTSESIKNDDSSVET